MSQILYNIKQAFVQIGRNKAMSLASVFAITAMMLILGLFFVITVNINLFTEMVKSDYEQVEIFLLDETTAEDAQAIMDKIEGRKGVDQVEYRTKEDALNIMKSRWGESSYLLDSLGNNPLPNSILITVDTLESAGDVTDYAASFDGVEDVKYYQETVEKLTKVTKFLQIAALIIMAFLVVVSIVVVCKVQRNFYHEICRCDQLVHQRSVPCGRDHYRNCSFHGLSRNHLWHLQQGSGFNRHSGDDYSVVSAGACRIPGGEPDLYLFGDGNQHRRVGQYYFHAEISGYINRRFGTARIETKMRR